MSRTVKKLKVIFTGWRAAFKTDADLNAYKQSLFLALVDKGINSDLMINRGLRRAEDESIHCDFIPPANRFAFWCKPQPEDFGLLCAEDAYRIASVESGKHASIRQWPDEVVYKTSSEFGFRRLAGQSEAKSIKEFSRIYEFICSRYIGGERFALPESQQLEESEAKPLSKGENSRRMQQLMADMGW